MNKHRYIISPRVFRPKSKDMVKIYADLTGDCKKLR
ncbi:hypothetical protein [Staphylococcus phage SpP]